MSLIVQEIGFFFSKKKNLRKFYAKNWERRHSAAMFKTNEAHRAHAAAAAEERGVLLNPKGVPGWTGTGRLPST